MMSNTFVSVGSSAFKNISLYETFCPHLSPIPPFTTTFLHLIPASDRVTDSGKTKGNQWKCRSPSSNIPGDGEESESQKEA